MTKLGYTNWRGEHTVRDITPFHLWFGKTQWHPEPQWFIRAFDHNKQAERDFELSGFGPVPQEAPAEPVAEMRPCKQCGKPLGSGVYVCDGRDTFSHRECYFYPVPAAEPAPAPVQLDTAISDDTKRALAEIDRAVRYGAANASSILVGEPAPPARQDALREAAEAVVKWWDGKTIDVYGMPREMFKLKKALAPVPATEAREGE